WPSTAEYAESGVESISAVVAQAGIVPDRLDDATVDGVLRWSTVPLDRIRLRDRLGELRRAPWGDPEGDGASLRLAAARAALERLLDATPAFDAEPPPDLVVHAGTGSSELDLVPGGLQLVDLPPGQVATAELEFRDPVVLGVRGRRFAVEVGGGLGGLLVDLRDVPLHLPERLEQRRELLAA